MSDASCRTVLLVDDDGGDREALERSLAAAGEAVRLLQVQTASEALQTVEREQVDCAFVDSHLPDHDGRWLIRELRARAPGCAVVAVSSRADHQTGAELMKAGACEFLHKANFSSERVSAAYRAALRVAAAEASLRAKEEALRRTEERFRLALSGSGLMVFEQDTHLRYTYLHNPQGTRQQADVEGRTDDELFAPSAAQLNAMKRRALAGERVREDVEVEGEIFHLVVQPRLDDEGRVAGIVGTAENVTARRRAHQFEQQLVGIVSHDLRNPIGAILMSAAVLMRRADTDAATRRTAERITVVAQRTARLIRDLLDFTQARIGNGIPVAPREMDFHDVAAEVVDELSTLYPAREVRLIRKGDGRGEWDPDRVAQVMGNLVTNALTYSPPETPVTVTVSEDREGVEFCVHNHGTPLPKERMRALFEPFERGHSQDGRGIGLGLYIVRALVEGHGGTVHAESSETDGIRFIVRLPRKDRRMRVAV